MASRKFSCRYAWNPELDVYDKNQDQEKSVFQQLYEADPDTGTAEASSA